MLLEQEDIQNVESHCHLGLKEVANSQQFMAQGTFSVFVSFFLLLHISIFFFKNHVLLLLTREKKNGFKNWKGKGVCKCLIDTHSGDFSNKYSLDYFSLEMR